MHALLRFLSIVTFAALASASPAASPRADAPVIAIIGDSISAGYGLPPGQVWVTLLEARLKKEGYPHRVVNASITGDTTAGGRARLPAILQEHRPAIVVIELGGNDALRGQQLAATRANLDAMVTAAHAAGAKVLVVGMRIPPNYGPAYGNAFNALFGDVAKARGAASVPYLFEGFGEELAMFQSDRVHPTAEAQPRMLATVWPALKPLLGTPR
ncbi:MAG TPA: arylesterase [Casimicrobiaceae bacterium]|nr:arylesterase [Casimicrobiaceae bacterium]